MPAYFQTTQEENCVELSLEAHLFLHSNLEIDDKFNWRRSSSKSGNKYNIQDTSKQDLNSSYCKHKRAMLLYPKQKRKR